MLDRRLAGVIFHIRLAGYAATELIQRVLDHEHSIGRSLEPVIKFGIQHFGKTSVMLEDGLRTFLARHFHNIIQFHISAMPHHTARWTVR